MVPHGHRASQPNPDYSARALEHAPQSPQEVADAARELAGRGFSDHTVAAVLKLDVMMVRRLIGERSAS